MRFMRYLLFSKSNHRIRVSHHELTSAVEGHPVSEEVLQTLQEDEYNSILNFFEENVIFMNSKNPTGKRVGRLFI